MANSHQAFSNRDVRRVFLSRFAPHDLVADRRTDLLKSDPTKEAGSIPGRGEKNERTNIDRSAVSRERDHDSTTMTVNNGPKKKEFSGDSRGGGVIC